MIAVLCIVIGLIVLQNTYCAGMMVLAPVLERILIGLTIYLLPLIISMIYAITTGDTVPMVWLTNVAIAIICAPIPIGLAAEAIKTPWLAITRSIFLIGMLWGAWTISGWLE